MQDSNNTPELNHVTRLGIMGEIAANLAHELNQPLAAISLYCDAALTAAQSVPVPDPGLISLLESAREQAVRAGEIVRHMRQFIRSADPTGKAVQLNELTRQMIAYMGPEADKKHVSIDSSLDDELPELTINRVQMAQVLGTLLHLSMASFDDDRTGDRKILVSTSMDANAVKLSVHHSGSNSHAVKNDIQTSNGQDVADIALSISRSIVEAHEGRLLRFADQFDVTLPVNTS